MRTFLMVRTFDLLFMDYESGNIKTGENNGNICTITDVYESGKMKLANLQTCGRFHTSHTYMYIIKGIGVSGVVWP